MITLQHPPQDGLHRILSDAVRATIVDVLRQSKAGHCLRISALPETVMRSLCAEFYADGVDADVVLLRGPNQAADAPWQVSATRLIELRNTEARPLLAFIPPGLKAAAEDSFDISTFVEIELGDIPARLRRKLREQLPDELGHLIDRVIHYLQVVEQLIGDDDVVRYYLTILENGTSRTAAGGALYQLRLVPDFALLDAPEHIETRLLRNVAAVRTLIESNQPLLGRIHELKLKADTLQPALYGFLRNRPLDAVAEWGRTIATSAEQRHLAFDRWEFEGEALNHTWVLLYMDDLDLPARQANQPIGPDNPRYLHVNRATSVKIAWETNPKPAAVNDLAYFRVQIVSSDGAIVWESKNIPNGTSRQAGRSKTIKVSEFRERIEDGLYFFRVRAYSDTGNLLNEEDAEEHPEVLRDRRNPESKRINESEDVWFWVDGDTPPPAEPQRNVVVHSFLGAQLHVQFAALDRRENPFSDQMTPQVDKTGWATAKGKRTEAIYNIVYDAQTRFTLPISSLLREIESRTLTEPETLGRWRLSFLEKQVPHAVQPVPRQFRDIGQVPAPFLQARRALFHAIRQGARECLTATVDLLANEDLILNYADAYSVWLSEIQADFERHAVRQEDGRRRTDPLFLDLDIVEVLLSNGDALQDRVYLLAPTHPLRLLWHLQHARMARAWLQAAYMADQPAAILPDELRRFLRRGLAPMNMPPIVRAAHEGYPESPMHFYVEQGALTPFWSLYIRQDVSDSRALRARVQYLLGVGRQSASAGAVGGPGPHDLVQKLRRYLLQHPYVRTLKINCFNPGDAVLVVDTILALEKTLREERGQAGIAPLRYELRLFAQGRVDAIGAAVTELLNPERQVSAEADVFSVPSQNHLFPKLRFSRNYLEDFLQQPERYEAHISILHDLFPVGVTIEPYLGGRSSFVYGLIQEQVTHFAGDHAHYAWQRQLVPSACQELPGDMAQLSARLATLLGRIANLQAGVAAGKPVTNVTPTLQLQLEISDKNLLHQVHACSDWVFVIDRHLGLEYFDSDVGDDRPVYLLDFTPEFGGTDTERLLLTTRAIDEVTRLIRPRLFERDLLLGDGVELYFLQLLRSLSGRIALKMLASPSSVSETLGLALARLFLEQYGLLSDRIVLPLDAHIGLFAEADQALALEEEVALQRSDLLLITCQPKTRTLHFHIIEVKWRSDLGDLNAYITLRQQIEAQLLRSEEALRRHFDPHHRTIDRIDRQIKTKELIALLSFYLDRSHRYGLVSEQAAASLRPFIGSLDQGYGLTCASAGLIFDFGYQGVIQEEEHAGLIFHRIGGDYIQRMLENGLRRRAQIQANIQAKPVTIEAAEQLEHERSRIVRDTSMSGDASYRRVRTSFGATVAQPLPDGDHSSAAQGGFPAADEPHIAASGHPAAGERPPDHDHATSVIDPDRQPDQSPVALVEQPVDMADSLEAALLLEAQPSSADRASDEIASIPGAEAQTAPPYDVMLGETGLSKQYGILGRAAGKIAALDLNGTNTISLFGVQGGGKSYTVGGIIEMATMSIPGISLLPAPLASVIFHYHESQDYAPEFVSMGNPNSKEDEVRTLAQEYGAHPARLEDVLILTSADKLAERRAEFPSVRVEPIAFSSGELSIKDWRFLMGVFGDQMYMKQVNLIMRHLRGQMTLEHLRHAVDDSDLTEGQKRVVRSRLNFAAQFIDDTQHLADVLRPGRLIIVDLRDELIEKDEALGLFVVMLNIFAGAGRNEGFNKLIVFDEAHKYMDNPDLTSHIVDVIRQMRHQGVSVLIASQDPPSLPNAIIELSSLVILHRFNSPQWLKHIQKSITALADLSATEMANLRPGEAYVWANKTTERIFTQKAVKIRFRPRVTQHGGGTKTAV